MSHRPSADRLRCVWWRDEPLSNDDSELLMKVLEAHIHSALRDNASSIAAAIAADSSQDMARAMAAGLMTLGGRHAPLERTYRLLNLDEPVEWVKELLYKDIKIPGWGNSFIKGKPDPLWEDVSHALGDYHPKLHDKISAVTTELHDKGKVIFPNPSAYTAATAIALGMNEKSAVFLFIWGRIDAWAKIATDRMEVRTWAT